ncbi:MAG: insulinase family protein [Gammaproteobacteria bacterium]|nr:insulinase family protein [Gammaproteobacteria bacterium]
MFHTLKKCTLVIAALLLTGCNDIHEITLPNGLRVIVKEDHRAPVVVSMVWYKVGSVDEPVSLTGISHALEHMMFKGTTHLKPNEFSRIIADNGGRENAFTYYDYTGYYQQLEKSRLPIAFELEADRMQNLTLDAGEFRKEIQVVMEERRLRTDDQPQAQVYEKFMATAYKAHPYGHPVIGWMADIEHLRIDDLRTWYKRWYVPNNATLIVVGDVKPAAVFDLAKKYFGPIPSRSLERTPISAEPPQQEPRRITVKIPAELPYLLTAFHVPVHSRQAPAEEAWEPYALDVLTGVLDGGQSARFETELVRATKVAAGIGTSYHAIARFPQMLSFSGTPSADHTVADLEQALKGQIERVQREPVSKEELERVKAQVIAGDVFERDSVFSQAYQIGELAMAGLDLDLLDKEVERLNAITPEQVMTVARKYLRENNQTTAVLDPLPLSEAPPRPRRGMLGGRHDIQ